MRQEPEPSEVDLVEPANREAEHMLLFFALPTVRASPRRHAKDPVPFLRAASHGYPW
jgi:hypothetical protein